MFTGIIEEQASVISLQKEQSSHHLWIKANLSQSLIGESIAINGVCLTLKESDELHFCFELSPETQALTNLSQLKAGDKVNLERAMQAQSRFGGHYVSGHVDAMAFVEALVPQGDCLWLKVGGFESSVYPYLFNKGSICLDGVSLTINRVQDSSIELMLISHTLKTTTFDKLKLGQRLNVEFDYLARIVLHQMALSGAMELGSLR